MKTLALAVLALALSASPTYHSATLMAGRTVRMNVSGYCAGACCCGKFADGITASGQAVTANGGKFIAAPRAYAFGTRMIVPGYNDGKPTPVLDRGGAIKGNKLDVFFPTHRAALEWGRRYLLVKIEKEKEK